QVFHALLKVAPLSLQGLKALLVAALGLADDLRRSGVTLRNERDALLDPPAHVLLVNAASKLKKVVRVGRLVDTRREELGLGRRLRRGRDRLLRLHGGRCSAGAAALKLVDAGVGSDQALTQLLVLLVEAPKLDDDLVEEVID